jgi:hypothetical protein
MATWTQMSNPFGSSTVTGASCIGCAPNGDVYVGGAAGFVKSTDAGATWTDAFDSAWSSVTGISSIGLNDIGELLVGVGNDSGSLGHNLGLWRRTGGAWARCTNTAGGFVSASQGVGKVCIDSTGAVIAVTGFDGDVWRSTNHGASFALVANAVGGSGGVSGGAIGQLACDPANGDLYAGGEIDGVYKSTDNGSTWTLFGLTGADGYNSNLAALLFNANGELIAGRPHGGASLSRYVNGAWQNSASGITTFCLIRTVLKAPDGTLYCSEERQGQNSDVFKSTDHGASWTQFSNGLDLTNPFRFMALSPTTGSLYLLTKGTNLLFYKTAGAAPSPSPASRYDVAAAGRAFGVM